MSSNSVDKSKYDPSSYPRVYKSSLFTAAVDVAWKGPLVALVLIGWYRYALMENEDTDTSLLLVFFTVALLGLLYALTLFRAKVVLNPDAIIVQGAAWPKKIPRENIAGIRTWKYGGVKHIELKLKRPLNKAYAFQMPYTEDTDFGAWFYGIKNLDSDRPAREVSEYDRQETSAKMLLESIARAKRKVIIAAFLSPFIGLAWALIYPHPYALVVGFVVALPWIAIVLLRVYEDFFTAGKKSKRTASSSQLSLFVLVPGYVMVMRALTDVHLMESIQWEMMIYLTLCGSALMVLIALIVAPIFRKDLGLAALHVVTLIPYVWGSLVISNQYFDHSAPRQFSTAIVDKHAHKHRRRAMHYSLTLPNLNFGNGNSDVSVNRRLYSSVSKGDNVCISIYPGVFGFGWYTLQKSQMCPSGTDTWPGQSAVSSPDF